MKNLILIAVIILIFRNSGLCQVKQLTPEQKEKDFEFIYEALKDNYSFFGALERNSGVDWPAQKDEYLSRIVKTVNDSAYIFALKSILDELQSGHVNFNPTLYANKGYLQAYKKISVEYPNYKKWVDAFENPKARAEYWAGYLANMDGSTSTEKENMNIKPKPNYSDTIVNKNTAIMTILSFNMHSIDKDKPKIAEFLKKINNCKYLIIDIQENSGGAAEYWRDCIVGRMISSPIIYTTYPIIKGGKINRYFYSDFFEGSEVLTKKNKFKKTPAELLDGTYFVKTEKDTINPNNPIGFSGQIFLLVSGKVFSSSEGFAQFCKTTKWATVTGTRTGGDGIGSDPAIIVLPESGILVCYPSLVGLNHDGSLNSEEKTVPDIYLKGKNSVERLENLLLYLNSKK